MCELAAVIGALGAMADLSPGIVFWKVLARACSEAELRDFGT